MEGRRAGQAGGPCCHIKNMIIPRAGGKRWPETLFQTPTPRLFQNFWIRVRQFFKFENSTPVQTPATIIDPSVIYPRFYIRNDHTDSCYCRNWKVIPDPVFPKILTPGPDPGINEKRKILPESTTVIRSGPTSASELHRRAGRQAAALQDRPVGCILRRAGRLRSKLGSEKGRAWEPPFSATRPTLFHRPPDRLFVQPAGPPFCLLCSPPEMSGLGNFSVWGQSWSDKIKSDPAWSAKILKINSPIQSGTAHKIAHTIMNVYFASRGKSTTGAILPSAKYDWLKAK